MEKPKFDFITHLLLKWWEPSNYANVWENVTLFYTKAKLKNKQLSEHFNTIIRSSGNSLFKSCLLIYALRFSSPKTINEREDARGNLVFLLAEDSSLDLSLSNRVFPQIPGKLKSDPNVNVTLIGDYRLILDYVGTNSPRYMFFTQLSEILLNNDLLMKGSSEWAEKAYEGIYRHVFENYQFLNANQLLNAQKMLKTIMDRVHRANKIFQPPFRSLRYLTGSSKMYLVNADVSLNSSLFLGIVVPQIFYEGNRQCYDELSQNLHENILNLYSRKIFLNLTDFKTDLITQKTLGIEVWGRMICLKKRENLDFWKDHLKGDTMVGCVFAFVAYLGNLDLFKELERYVLECREASIEEVPDEMLLINEFSSKKHLVTYNSLSKNYILTGRQIGCEICFSFFVFLRSPLISAIVFGRTEITDYILQKLPEESLGIIFTQEWMNKLSSAQGQGNNNVQDFIQKHNSKSMR